MEHRAVGQGELDHVLGWEISLVLVVAGVHRGLQSHHVRQLHLSVQGVPLSLHLRQAVVQVQDIPPGRVAVVVAAVAFADVVAVVVGDAVACSCRRPSCSSPRAVSCAR